ncbi:MAG: hypothetical protein N4A46_03940 [Schleiferiaceae bacterium]|nr:hypothetical protein [Schleiferiaceae bacterium]
MKYLVTILCLVSLLLCSCKKETQQQPPPAPLFDSIMYSNPEPDLLVSAVDSVYSLPLNPCTCIPAPDNGIDFTEIDMDGDGQNDFKIEYRHRYEHLSNSSPCVNYLRRLSIESLSPDGGIAVTRHNGVQGVIPYALGDTISQKELFVFNGSIYEKGVATGYSFGKTGYVGVKLPSGSVGWISIEHQFCDHKCFILEYALNKTSTNTILAGQTH